MESGKNQLTKKDAASGFLRRALFVSVLFQITTAFGEETNSHLLNLSLEELGSVKVDTVFAASKFSEKVTDAPSSVTILTRDEIARLGYRTLADAIRGVRSFDVTYDRNYYLPGVRGFNQPGDFGTRILLLVDGHRVNDIIYDQSLVGRESLVDLDEVDRIEFIRGPGSAIYGSNAFFGVISVVTRKGGDVNGLEVSGSAETFDGYMERMTIGKRLANGLEFKISGSNFASRGTPHLYYPEYRETNRGYADFRDGNRAFNLSGTVSYGDFTLRGGYAVQNKDVPTASYGTIFNEQADGEDTHGFAELAYAHTFAGGWNLFARGYYDYVDYHGVSLYDNDEPGARIRNNDSGRARWWGGEAGLSKSFLNGFRFTFGADYRETLSMGLRNYDERPYSSYLDVRGELAVFGAYLDTSYKISKWLNATAGLRLDDYSSFGRTVNPRFGLILRPAEKTTVKLLYGEAFRAPTLYELTYEATEQKANPGLQPERVRTFEIVGEHYFDPHWKASVSLYQNDISDLINQVTDPDGLDVYRNGGDAQSRGVEAEIEGKWDGGWLARASYAHQSTEDGMTGQRLTNSPENVVKTQLLAPLWREKLSLGVEGIYSSNRITLAQRGTGDMWLLNATLLSRELRPNLEISASIYNVFDRKFRFPGNPEHTQDTIEQDGRTFRVKVSYKF